MNFVVPHSLLKKFLFCSEKGAASFRKDSPLGSAKSRPSTPALLRRMQMVVEKREESGKQVSLWEINAEPVSGSFYEFKLMLHSRTGERLGQSSRMLHFDNFVPRAMED